MDRSTSEGATPGASLSDWLARRAALSPDRFALIAGAARWSFADLNRRVAGATAQLRARQVQPGDRIALLVGNTPAFVTLAHAIPRQRAILVPLNSRLAAPELAWQLGDVGARLLVHDTTWASLAAKVQRLQPDLQLLRDEDVNDADGRSSPGESSDGAIDTSTVHTIIYTSGTTGRPKGVMLTHGNHWWSAIGSLLNLGLHADDRWLAVLPLFHVGGLAILLRGVIYGIPVVLHERFDPVAVNRAIDADGVTIVSVVSTMLQRMLDARGESPFPPSLRCVLLGGGPAPVALLERCAGQRVPVVQTYGLTEAASQVATLAPADAHRKLGSAGQPLLSTELRIERDGGPAPLGTVGEILVRGPSVTIGYFHRPEDTARALRDGWLHTGDLGYRDDDGYLYVVDRRADLIISGGENVYPAEVEATLLAHAGIEDAGVVGVPDPRWGQVPIAAVVQRPGAASSAAEIIAFCAERLARYKVPAQVCFVDALPRNAAGKLRRAVLRERLSEDHPADVPAEPGPADRPTTRI